MPVATEWHRSNVESGPQIFEWVVNIGIASWKTANDDHLSAVPDGRVAFAWIREILSREWRPLVKRRIVAATAVQSTQVAAPDDHFRSGPNGSMAGAR